MIAASWCASIGIIVLYWNKCPRRLHVQRNQCSKSKIMMEYYAQAEPGYTESIYMYTVQPYVLASADQSIWGGEMGNMWQTGCEHKAQCLWQYIQYYQSMLGYYFTKVRSRIVCLLFYCFSSCLSFGLYCVFFFFLATGVVFWFICQLVHFAIFILFFIFVSFTFILCVRYMWYKYKDKRLKILKYFRF